MKSARYVSTGWLAGMALFGLLAGCSESEKTQAPIPDPQDDAPPIAPSSFQKGKVDGSGFSFSWAPNVEPDLSGYRVYLYDPSPFASGAYRLLNPDALAKQSHYACKLEDTEATEAMVRVSAVDLTGNESSMSEPFTIALGGGPLPTEPDPEADEDTGGTRGPGAPGTPDNGPGKEPGDDGGDNNR